MKNNSTHRERESYSHQNSLNDGAGAAWNSGISRRRFLKRTGGGSLGVVLAGVALESILANPYKTSSDGQSRLKEQIYTLLVGASTIPSLNSGMKDSHQLGVRSIADTELHCQAEGVRGLIKKMVDAGYIENDLSREVWEAGQATWLKEVKISYSPVLSPGPISTSVEPYDPTLDPNPDGNPRHGSHGFAEWSATTTAITEIKLEFVWA